MNHIYRSIWSEALGTWVAVSEHTTGQGKRSANRSRLLMTGLLVCTSPAWALPTGNQLVDGQASVSNPAAHQMQIDQTSQRAAINWQGFSIQQHETVNIHQPNSNAALLNRVVGQDASQIQGKLNANGQVYLVNPNGVVFSKTARVDVGGLVATTHNISNADFMNGKNHFTQDGAKGTVENHGTINSKEGGVVALIGEKVTNTGSINTPKGTTALAAGKTVDLDFQGDGLVEVKVSEAALKAQIDNKGVIQADGGRVVMTTKAANQLVDTVINQDGIVKAKGLVERNGEIILAGDYVSQTGSLDASGHTGGKVDIQARAIVDSGKINADGTVNQGGNINLKASDAIIQTATAETHANGKTTGGTVHLEATNSVYSSAKLSSKGGDKGGTVDVLSNNRVVLAAADVDASGQNQGGLIRVGGDFHGAKTKLSNSAKTTIINGSSKLKADGGKGQVVVWSDEKTDYHGSISANKGGEIEVSSKGDLIYAGTADAGVGGNLLLDPKNIIISNTGSVASYALIDPHLAAGNLFGAHTAILGTTLNGVFTENGNIAVTSQGDDLAALNAGAVYLFNSTTGALLSTVVGFNSNDSIGSGGVTALSNGNYVIASPEWGRLTPQNLGIGAATWANGVTGISGSVSAANSLVGSSLGDLISSNGITALTNGNYVVNSSYWNGGFVNGLGAVTLGNGATGTSGIVSAANSLVGSIAGDTVGSNGITALTNGNYVVASSNWNNGISNFRSGAVTWGNGNSGIVGAITTNNSLIGTTINDFIGNRGVTALTNGNYVIASPNWSSNRGAATWGNGATGTTGAVGSFNSLVGATTNDQVSSNGITALANGHYVVISSNWGDTFCTSNNKGAVTWGNGNSGTIGTVTSSNSLVGANTGDQIGSRGVTALTNGNYVIASPDWNINTGAATWANGTGPSTGTVNSGNSLIGSAFGDAVSSGGITALTNGNYVVISPNWTNNFCAGGSLGAVTWSNGTINRTGTVNSANSLIGSNFGDSVGNGGVTALTNGNYVVNSPDWSDGAIARAGAATWGNGVTGLIGSISVANSLIGSSADDMVGYGGTTALPNGNYVVKSVLWNNSAASSVGATTWGNGLTGTTGFVNFFNSLTGSADRDFSGGEGPFVDVKGLSNGNYVVSNSVWDNTGLVDAGQVRIATPQNIFFNNGLGQNMIFNPSMIADTLALGTNITLQASNDITLDTGTYIFVPGSSGGTLTLQAGRNITLNSNIVTANGNFTAIAGDPNAIAADREAGTPTLTLGATIDAGLGKVILAAINGNFVYNPPVLSTTPTLFSLAAAPTSFAVAAANTTSPTDPINASQWFIFSTDPRLNTLNGLQANFKRYGQPFTGTIPSFAGTGNWLFYSNTPQLTVTPVNQTITFGTAPSNFAFILSGFIDGDTLATAGISGNAVFNVGGGSSPDGFFLVGNHDVSYLSGLLSSLGYSFIDNTLSTNELTVIEPVITPPAPILPPPSPAPFINLDDQLAPLQTSVTAIKDPEKLHNPPGEIEIFDEGMNLAFLMDKPYTYVPRRQYICEWRPNNEPTM